MTAYASTNQVTNLDDLTKGMLIAHPTDPARTIKVEKVKHLTVNRREALVHYRLPGTRATFWFNTPTLARFDRRIEVVPGLAATIPLVSAAEAAVVIRVTAQTVVVQRVRTGRAAKAPGFDVGAYGLAVMDQQGILDQPIPGTERRFTRKVERNGRIAYWNGRTRLVLGASFSRRDWRD